MTPRLRILSIGLALSLAYAIYDYVDRNNTKKSVVSEIKKIKTRARTAGVSASRYENLKKRWAKKEIRRCCLEKRFQSRTVISYQYPEKNISELDGWERNPFVEVYEPKSVKKKVYCQRC